jgi:hypothetical protein
LKEGSDCNGSQEITDSIMREFVELLHGFDSSNGPIDVGDRARFS